MRDFVLVGTMLDILDDYLYDKIIDFIKPYEFYHHCMIELKDFFQSQPRYNYDVRWFVPLYPTPDTPFYHFKKKRIYYHQPDM